MTTVHLPLVTIEMVGLLMSNKPATNQPKKASEAGNFFLESTYTQLTSLKETSTQKIGKEAEGDFWLSGATHPID
jgi:hypothetical protein